MYILWCHYQLRYTNTMLNRLTYNEKDTLQSGLLLTRDIEICKPQQTVQCTIYAKQRANADLSRLLGCLIFLYLCSDSA